MKTLKNVYPSLFNKELIFDEFNSTLKKVKRHKIPEKVLSWDKQTVCNYYSNMLLNYKHKKHQVFEIVDGTRNKTRKIVSPSFDEVVIQHLIANPIERVVNKRVNENVYGSIPGRGPHSACKKIESWIQANKSDTRYCLQIDIKKFFNSIDIDILYALIKKCIPDKKYLKLVKEILSESDKGVPLGFYTSHWFAQLYLLPLDEFILHILKPCHYIRYMDDILIFHNKKSLLKGMRKKIEKFLNNKLGLRIKENWQVYRVSYISNSDNTEKGRPVDFIGFVFHRNRTTLRKSILNKVSRKAKHIKNNKMNIYSARQMISYLGWFKYTDTLTYYKNNIEKLVSFPEVKEYISKYDKRKRKKKNNNRRLI